MLRKHIIFYVDTHIKFLDRLRTSHEIPSSSKLKQKIELRNLLFCEKAHIKEGNGSSLPFLIRLLWQTRFPPPRGLNGIKSMTLYLRFLIVLVCFSIMACPGNSNQTQTLAEKANASQTVENETALSAGNYTLTHFQSYYGEVDRFLMKSEVLQQKRSELASHKLIELDFTQNFATRAYQLRLGNRAPSIILKPRLLLRSTFYEEEPHIERLESGKLILNVSIALVNGMISKIPSGIGQINLPKSYLIPNQSQFLAHLRSRVGGLVGFHSQIPCPEHLRIRLDGEPSFPISFKSKLLSCPMNEFLPAELVIWPEDWNRIKRSFLREGSLEVEMENNLSTPVITEYANFRLNPHAVFTFLRSHLSEGERVLKPYRVQKLLEDLVSDLQRELQTEFPDEFFTQLKEASFETFFERQVGRKVQFSLVTQITFGSGFSFTLKREQYVGRPLFIRSRSILVDNLAQRLPVQIRASHKSPLNPPDPVQLGEETNLARTIEEGELLELSIESLEVGSLKLDQPVVNQENYLYCLQPYSGGYTEKLIWTAPALRPMVKTVVGSLLEGPRSHLNFFPKLQFPYRIEGSFPISLQMTSFYGWQCTDLWANQCDPQHLEGRWRKTVVYQIPISKPIFIPRVIERQDLKALIEGISFQFRSDEVGQNTKTLCPLSSLPYEILPQNRILVTLKNTPGCPLFNDETRGPSRDLSISILNRSFIRSQFQCGSVVETSEGERTYRCTLADGSVEVRQSTVAQDQRALTRGAEIGVFRPYYPRLQIQARVRSVGSYFGNKNEEDL